MFGYFAVFLLATSVRATCIGSLANCTDISSHSIYVGTGNDDFYTDLNANNTPGNTIVTCNQSWIDLSSGDLATFGFVIASDLWFEDHVFSSSIIRFKAFENATNTSMVKIRIEEQGVAQSCGSLSNFTLLNQSVTWTIPSFVKDEYYSTPDLSPLLNALSVCPTYVVFRFESFYDNETAWGSRKIESYESNVNATRLTLNAACPTTTTGVATTGTTTSDSTSPAELTLAERIGLWTGVTVGALIIFGVIAWLLMQ
jgi:hypothetical protein